MHWWVAEVVDTSELKPVPGAEQSVTVNVGTANQACARITVFDKLDGNGYQRMGPFSSEACA